MVYRPLTLTFQSSELAKKVANALYILVPELAGLCFGCADFQYVEGLDEATVSMAMLYVVPSYHKVQISGVGSVSFLSLPVQVKVCV